MKNVEVIVDCSKMTVLECASGGCGINFWIFQ